MNFPTLYDIAKTGKTKTWKIWVDSTSQTSPVIFTEAGYIDGKKQISQEVVLEGKNLGKANETTPYEQAVSQATSTWLHKKDKGYVESLEAAETKEVELLPMLAHKFSERAHDIQFPCYVSGKLDGCRMLAVRKGDTISFSSRGGKAITTLDHIAKELMVLMKDGEIFDGEVYIHGTPLQTIMSAVKKVGPLTETLEYRVYDLADANKGFAERYDILKSRLEHHSGKVKLHVCDWANDVDDVYKFHAEYVKGGYEGTMLRNLSGGYMFKHRSSDLQKLKDFLDDEFLIIGCKTGTPGSKFDGCAIWQCKTKTGGVFDVVCEGPIALKQEQWKNRDKFINAMLTVRYQALTNDGIPTFGVGISVRESWDMS